MTLITGNTYPVKEQIKALGGTWNKGAQGWNVPDGVAEQARALVAAAPAGRIPDSTRVRHYGRSRYARFSSDEEPFGHGEHYVNRRGRCEDAPCCGCCS